MGLITTAIYNLGQWLTKAAPVLPDKVQGVVGTQIRSFEDVYGHSQGREGFDKLIKRYVSWVYACANINAQAVASVPLRLYVAKQGKGQRFLSPTKQVSSKRKDFLFSENVLQHKLSKAYDIEEVTEHPFLNLMEHVNPYMNGFDLLEYWVLYQELTGNAYTLLINNNLGVPVELWVLPAQAVKIVPSKDRMIDRYLLGDDPRTQQSFEPEEIMHLKYANPDDIYYGKGPLAAAVLAADTHQGMSDHEYSLLRNSAIPPIIINTKQPLNEASTKKLKDEWNAAYRGPNKAGKTAILGGDIEIQPLGLSPKEMGYLLGQKIKQQEIAAIFGVPMSLLTVEDVASAPATGMIMGNMTYARRTILPKCRRIEQKLNEQLIPLYDDKLFVAFDNPVPEDEQSTTTRREANLRMGFTTINEEREEANLEPVAWGRTPWMPMNLIPIGSGRPRPQTEPEPDTEPDPMEEDSEQEGKAHHHKEAFCPSCHNGGGNNKSAPTEPSILGPEDLPPASEQIARIVRRMFRQQKKEMLETMPKKSTGSDWLPNSSKWVAYLIHKSKPIISQLVGIGGKQGMSQLGAGLVFDRADPQMEAFIDQWTYNFSFAVDQETIRTLKDALQESLHLGETYKEMGERIQTVFDDMSDYRADRIARTETVRAMNAGVEQGWIQSGIVQGKEWLGASDMCELCQTMNAQYGPGTGGIPLGGTFMDIDYGPVNGPPAHPHCRCTLISVLKKQE